MSNNIANHGSIAPVIPASAYIHHSAQVIGDVVLGENVSVWPMAVIRGDVNRIRIGDNSNIRICACCTSAIAVRKTRRAPHC